MTRRFSSRPRISSRVFCTDAENGPPALLKEMVERNHLGMKTRRGFWEWTDESAAKEKNRIERALQAGMEILKADMQK